MSENILQIIIDNKARKINELKKKIDLDTQNPKKISVIKDQIKNIDQIKTLTKNEPFNFFWPASDKPNLKNLISISAWPLAIAPKLLKYQPVRPEIATVAAGTTSMPLSEINILFSSNTYLLLLIFGQNLAN